MSLSRALTKRIGNRDRENSTSSKESSTSNNTSSSFSLSISTKRNSMGIKKGLISAPVELISTTNNTVYTAPTVSYAQKHPTRISTDAPPSPTSSSSTPPLTPDNGCSDHDLPTPPLSPARFLHRRSDSASSNEKMHSSHKRSSSRTVSHRSTPSVTNQSPFLPNGPPAIPTRSGSRRSAENRAQRPTYTQQPPFSQHPQQFHHQHQQPKPKSGSHPFGKELAQVSELAEEMGLDLDEECMVQRGLQKWTVEDYLREVEEVVVVQGLFGRQPPMPIEVGGGWI